MGSTNQGTDIVVFVVGELIELIQPLSDAVDGGSQGLTLLVSELGYPLAPGDAPIIITAMNSIPDPTNSSAPASLSTLLTNLAAGLDNLDVSQLLDGIRNIVEVISSLESLLTTYPSIGQRLFDYLVAIYLQRNRPMIYGILTFLGLVKDTHLPATPATPEYAINWENFPKVFNPSRLFQDVYGWGLSTFDSDLLLQNLQTLVQGIGIPAYYSSATATGSTSNLFVGFEGGGIQAGANVVPLSANNSNSDNGGVAVVPMAEGTIDKKINIIAGWAAIVSVTTKVQTDYGVLIRPGSLALGPIPGSPSTTGNLDFAIGLAKSNPAGGTFILFGKPDSTRVQATTIEATVGMHPSNGEVDVELDFQGLQLVIDASDGDSFLGVIFGDTPKTLDLSSTVIWSSKTGFHFKGVSGFEIDIPINETMGVVEIDTLSVGLKLDDEVDVILAIGGGVTIGPIAASVDKLGIKLAFVPVGPGGARGFLGNLDLKFGFKPPNGLGLAVDAGPVSGGGYISYDADKGEYAGIFSLGIDLPGESVDVNIIALLDTKLPNGAPGYSFIVIVAATIPPVQLGLGFTLDGVGLVAGINRSMSLDALRVALKAHTIDSIFFPSDDPETLIAHAPQIISEVSAIFPNTPGAYVFGIVLELGWGTPTIVEAELGVVLELPDPVRLAILGGFKLGLPTLEVDDESELLVLVQIDILGTIDFEQKQLAIDGTIYDSHVVKFSISGDMALRYGWGANPNFAFSLGGFNPQFTPPAGFPSLQRFTIALGSGGDSLSLTSYLALTSNTAQVGADLELHASAAGFTVHGYEGFDALFIFTPFSFTVDMKGGLDLLQGNTVIAGIDLDLTLSGPNPWHAHGTASLTILFLSVSVNVDLTIGSPAAAPPLPSVAVVPLLVAALADSKNWKTQLPDEAGASVVFAKAAAGDQTILVHPRGTLSVDQDVVPLGIHLDKFGNDAPSDAAYLQIPHGDVTINSQTPDQVADTTDMFALGQFENLSDAQKLSLPAYQPMNGGVRLGSSEVQYGSPATLQMGYDTYYIEDMALPPRIALKVYTLDQGRALAQTQLSGASWSSRQGSGSQKYVAPGTTSPIGVQPPSYVIASTSDLTVQTGFSAGGTSQVQAQQALDTHLAQHPEDAGKFQVVNVAEAGATP